MTDPDAVPGLHDVLERATDQLDAATPMAARALVGAARRRRLRRGLSVGGVVAVVAVVAVAGAAVVDDSSDSTGPTTRSVTPPTEPAPTAEESAIDPTVIQERWDPRDVADLPVDVGVIPGLPAVIDPPRPGEPPQTVDPPASARPLGDSPLTDYAVLAVRGREAISLLSAAGEWRSIAIPARSWTSVALSPGGQQVAVRVEGRTDVWAVLTGERSSIADPPGYRAIEYPGVGWVDEATLLLDDRAGGWQVDVASGDAERVAYPRPSAQASTLDPRGVMVQSTDFPDPPAVVDWAGGDPRTLPTPSLGHLVRIAASEAEIAGAAYDGRALRGFAVFVVDRASGVPRAVLPILDFEGNYSNWALGVEAVRGDGSVVLRIANVGTDTSGSHLVRWEPDTGRLSVVAALDVRLTEWVVFSRDALR